MRINYKIPQKWNELTDYQITVIGKFMFNSSNEKVETRIIKRLFLSILVIPKPTFKNIWKSVTLFRDVPFSVLEQYTDFVFNEKETLTRFIPVIKVGSFFV